jgi:DNA polymerase III delta' subunit
VNGSPSSFADLIGETRPVTVLRNAIRRDRVAHAYLFHGPDGVGKSTAARLFAQALNCQRVQDGAEDACGECRSCLFIAKGNHPDVQTVTLELDEKRRQKTEIAIDQVRELIHDAHLKRVLGRYKVYIIDPADRMNQYSANALLKVVEEPPREVVLILVASQPAALLPTIISRCQKVAFQLAGTAAISKRLQQLGIGKPTAALLAALSGGRPGWAIRAAQQPQFLTARSRLLDLCADMESKPLGASLRIAEQIKREATHLAVGVPAEEDGDEEEEEPEAGGEKMAPVADRGLRAALPWCLEVMASWYRDRMAAASGGEPLNQDYADALSRSSGAEAAAQAGDAIEAILAARQYIIRNAHIDLALEALAIQLVGGAG